MHIIPSFLVDKGFFLPLRLSCKERLFSKTYPSFLTVKEGSTSHLGLLPSGKKRETALLGARNRYAIRLADHQRSAPGCAGWGRLEWKRQECLATGAVWRLIASFSLISSLLKNLRNISVTLLLRTALKTNHVSAHNICEQPSYK